LAESSDSDRSQTSKGSKGSKTKKNSKKPKTRKLAECARVLGEEATLKNAEEPMTMPTYPISNEPTAVIDTPTMIDATMKVPPNAEADQAAIVQDAAASFSTTIVPEDTNPAAADDNGRELLSNDAKTDIKNSLKVPAPLDTIAVTAAAVMAEMAEMAELKQTVAALNQAAAVDKERMATLSKQAASDKAHILLNKQRRNMRFPRRRSPH
jgi:hypothetical protein